ncbi:MAG: hypothetical protein E6Q59_07460 [Nitrosomonas sp.]|nr:MAG: hypothetical protein E6Q59_07460 [Nitrosomonas sp.]
MKTSYPSPIEFAVLAYCLWQASDLPISWLHAPLVRYAWIAFIIWCIPTLWHMSRSLLDNTPKGYSPYLLAAAITASLLGSLGSLHLLRHLGLAFAIGGIVPFHYSTLIWMATAIAWLPGFGWMIKSLPLTIIPIIQIVIAAVGSCTMILSLRRS